jgi:hypothetical protein
LRDDILLPLLREEVFPAAMFDHAGIRALVDEHYRGAASHEDVLAKLISWGLAVKFFLREETSDAPPEMFGR